ncbi:glycoprotease family-domain-containing protein [Poronia punctata]|nr:glycoprotease family-domain-containing protein [Poronia punctata]
MFTLWASSRQCLPRANPSCLQATWAPPVFGPLYLFSVYTAASPRPRSPSHQCRRQLLTLAIETSCDDTCVAILEKDGDDGARLYFNEKVTTDNRAHRGIHPLEASLSHNTHLARLTRKALRALPKADLATPAMANNSNAILSVEGEPRLKPDFISVTRGPGMGSCLATGLNTAKGLAIAWDVPLLAVNHMQAHALTPRLVSALDKGARLSGGPSKDVKAVDRQQKDRKSPQFPFLSLLVSGGHTMLVKSQSLNEHAILAQSNNIAVGDMLDKCARLILPQEALSTETAELNMYGPLFEEFAFPGSTAKRANKLEAVSEGEADYDYGYQPPVNRAEEIEPFASEFGWSLTPPLSGMGLGEEAASIYDFTGLNSQAQQVMLEHPNMMVEERRALARATMRLVFEHLTSRLLAALRMSQKTPPRAERQAGKDVPINAKSKQRDKVKTVVLSGGVASNKYLRHILRAILDIRGHTDVDVIAPPVSLCTDNAAMIAWTGMEMYESGFRSDLDVRALRKWPLDPNATDGGVLGVPGWRKVP